MQHMGTLLSIQDSGGDVTEENWDNIGRVLTSGSQVCAHLWPCACVPYSPGREPEASQSCSADAAVPQTAQGNKTHSERPEYI